MADELDEDFDPAAIEEDIDEENLDETAIDDDLADDDDELVDADALVESDDDEEVAAPAEPAAARAKKKAGDDEEDDDEELDPDDVEADLDTILKDRIAAADEDEDDEELEEVAPKAAESPDGVIPKRANEFTCTGCFLLVNRGQFGPEHNMRCPVGESDCPAIEELQATPKPKPAKAAARKR